MDTIDARAASRGRAVPFDISKIGAPPLPSEHFEVFDVTSAPKSWAGSARHWDLRPGDRILVDWSRRPDEGRIGAVRESGGVQFQFDSDASAEIGRLVNPSILLQF